MATESTTGSTTSSIEGTGTEQGSGQEQQGQQQGSTSETEGQGQQQSAPATLTIDDSTQLPETHPLVKTLATQKTELAALKTELTEARAKLPKVSELEGELAKRPTTEALTTLQTRYDRLEAFAQAVGIGKALDSRTFTRDLFETDKSVKDLVKDWNASNPTATSTALGAGASTPGAGKVDLNDVLRKAAGK